ncbi:serine/threonine protein kinase [Paenibacillus sp. MBLB4367]|uniref:serine/threonine protein kinase n=1 Tax=Paenibacillus sp. MBLB4367 TaxID=3384767 RepID=UPI0039084075
MFAWLKRIADEWNDYPLDAGTWVAGRFRIVKRLGMGSYGLAYQAVDESTGTPCLLKHDRPSKRGLSKKLLKREGDWLDRLGHPCIPKKLAMFQSGRRCFLVTEFVEGMTAEQLVFEQGRTWTERDTLVVIKQLAVLARHIHERGVVHRDIRLPNVIFAGEDLHLIDFGLACAIGESEPITYGLSGIPEPRRADRTDTGCDFTDIGEFALYLLYAGYESAPGQEDLGWEEELALHPHMRKLMRRLLEIDSPFPDAQALLDELAFATRTLDTDSG